MSGPGQSMRYFFFLFVLVLSSHLTFGSSIPVKLITNERFEGEMLSGEEKLFLFDSLQPLSQYEARISYPATNPAAFSLKLVCFTNEQTTSSLGRSLLNTEKIMFQTNELGEIATNEKRPLPPSFPQVGEGCLYGVSVVGRREGKPTDPHGSLYTSPLTYHLVLEQLFHPLIPVPHSVFMIATIFPFFFGFVWVIFRKLSTWTSESHVD